MVCSSISTVHSEPDSLQMDEGFVEPEHINNGKKQTYEVCGEKISKVWKWGPDPALPLLFHASPASRIPVTFSRESRIPHSRYFFTRIPHPALPLLFHVRIPHSLYFFTRVPRPALFVIAFPNLVFLSSKINLKQTYEVCGHIISFYLVTSFNSREV